MESEIIFGALALLVLAWGFRRTFKAGQTNQRAKDLAAQTKAEGIKSDALETVAATDDDDVLAELRKRARHRAGVPD